MKCGLAPEAVDQGRMRFRVRAWLEVSKEKGALYEDPKGLLFCL